jgi:hypothetical protein
MPLNLPRSTTSGLARTSLLALLLIAACASPPPPPPERPAAPSSELTFDAGVDYAIDDLLVQARRLPAFTPAPGGILKKEEPPVRGVIAVDPAIDIMADIAAFFLRSLDIAERVGIARSMIVLDPGIDFAKQRETLQRFSGPRNGVHPGRIGIARSRTSHSPHFRKEIPLGNDGQFPRRFRGARQDGFRL